MQPTDLEAFRKELLVRGGYETPAGRLAGGRRAPSAWVTLRFSWSVGRVFPLCALWDAFGALTTDRWAHFCFSCFAYAESCGMKVTLEGWGDRQRYDGPVVYLSNHMSTYETIALPPVLLTYGPFSFVAKESLTRLPGLAHAAALMGMVGVGRKNPKADLLKVYEVGGQRLADGQSFLVFPQGTRQRVFERRHFSSIGAKLAERAGVPIVPIAVDTRCLPTRAGGGPFKDFGTVDTARDVRIAAGPLIPCGKARDMHEASFAWIADRLEGWGVPVARER